MMNGIELIDWTNKDEVIRFYEANKLYFDNYEAEIELDSRLTIIDVKLSYCNALISKHHYTDCLEILTHLNILINQLKNDPIVDYSTRYEKYLLTEGVVFGYLKRYEESQSCFKELIQIDSKNDLYKDWFESNRLKIIYKQSVIVGYTGFGVVMIKIFIDIVFQIKLSYYVELIGFITMTLGFTFPYIYKWINKIKR